MTTEENQGNKMKKTKSKKKPKPSKTKERLKPISLYPLSLEQALEGAMSVPWPPKKK
jgi:hypothetical protein